MMNFFRLSFPLQMALATILGILFGLFLGDVCSIFAPWANAYIMILKITAVPYLICAIIHGMGLLNSGQAKQIFKKGIIFIGLATFLNVGLSFLIYWVFPQPENTFRVGNIAKDAPAINFIDILIPHNVFYDLSNNIVPAVVVFCILIGIALMNLAEKQYAMSALQTLLEALTQITRWISRIAPIGTFLIMANQAGTIQFSIIKQISTYIVLYIIGTSIVVFWIGPRLISMLTSIKFYEWLKSLIPVLVLAYTTNVVIVALPYIITTIQKQLQILYPKDENVRSQIQGTVSIIFNLPLGSLFTIAFVLFTSLFYAIKLHLSSQIKLVVTTYLTSLGSVGLGSWINNLNFILDTLGLPLDAINLFLTSLPFTGGFQSMVSVMLISTLAFLITLACRGLILYKWKKILQHALITILPVLALFIGLKFFNPFPKIHNQAKSIYDVEIANVMPVTIYTPENSIPPSPLPPQEDVLQKILRTHTIRVGYEPHTAPFCFFNKHQALAGFDISFAYELAKDLDVSLELVPLNYGHIAEDLESGYYDIAMSAVSITEERLKNMCFSAPLMDMQIVFVTLEKNRKRFMNLDKVMLDTDILIAAVKGTRFESFVRNNFPDHSIVFLDHYEDFAQDPPPADVLIWDEQESIAWTILHPKFFVVYPDPEIGVDTLGYPIRKDAGSFQCFLNGWLKLKKKEGFFQSQYDLWILSKTREAFPEERRWSVLHDVLHWQD